MIIIVNVFDVTKRLSQTKGLIYAALDFKTYIIGMILARERCGKIFYLVIPNFYSILHIFG